MNKSFYLRASKQVDKNKKTYAEKAAETKAHSARLAEMQKYVDMSEEKRSLLLDVIKNGRSSDSDETLLEKGVIVYVKFLEVIDAISSDLTEAGIDHYIITGKTKQKDRGEISKKFKTNPNSKVVLISKAAGESLNLNGSNELLLYDIPNGPGAYSQVLGRTVRSFSKFEEEGRSFYIHYIMCEDTCDDYFPILLSSKKELEEEILHSDTISLKETKSFDAHMLKEIRKRMLWKTKKQKSK